MLGHNPTQLDTYNKHAKEGQGTLIANWLQERVHRQQKGEGRAMTQTHFPKEHKNIYYTQGFTKTRVEDDTKYRILGDGKEAIGTTQNYHYGKGVNKANSLPRTGKKQQLIQQMYLQTVTANIQQQIKKQQQLAKKTQFQTTHQATFIPKPLTHNTIGRLIMRDQSGALVSLKNVDEDLRQANGFKEKGQITPDQQLKKLIDTNLGYQQQQPVTFWREKVEDGNFYMSKPSNNVFAKNNEFLKTFKSYKHYND